MNLTHKTTNREKWTGFANILRSMEHKILTARYKINKKYMNTSMDINTLYPIIKSSEIDEKVRETKQDNRINKIL